MDIGKYSHITLALYDLHWLPLHARIHFKILLLACKVIHGQAPAYLSSLVLVKSESFYGLHSNCSTLFAPPNGQMLATLGGRSFQAAVPQLWNALPPSHSVVPKIIVLLSSNQELSIQSQAPSFCLDHPLNNMY